jgi:hypothetical protein
MGLLRRLIVRLCLALLATGSAAGCAKKRSLEVPFKPAAAADQEAEPRAEDLYTRDGGLAGSDARVEWLEIPLAFGRPIIQNVENHTVFEAKGVSLELARDFLSERMLTGLVDEAPGNVYYRAVLAPSGGDAARLNVRLTKREAGTVLALDVERLPRNDEIKPLTVEQAKSALQAEQKRAH